MVILTIFVLFRLLHSNYFDLSLHTFTRVNTRIELMENGLYAQFYGHGAKLWRKNNVFVIFEFFCPIDFSDFFEVSNAAKRLISGAAAGRVAP